MRKLQKKYYIAMLLLFLSAILLQNAELHSLKGHLTLKLEESKNQLLCLNQENEVIQKECEKQE